MSGFIEDLRDTVPLRAAGSHNNSKDGVKEAARMAQNEEWTTYLLELRNDLNEALRNVSRELSNSWNATALRVGSRVDTEIRPMIEAYASDNGLDEAFVKAVRYAVMTAAMADEYRAHATVPGIDAVAYALLDGRLPCGLKNGALVSY